MYRSERSMEAGASVRREAALGRARDGFRPVALPALAAAVHAASRSVETKVSVPRATRIVHEDEPLL